MSFYKSLGKPISDFLFSLIIILLISPVIVIVSILLLVINSGSPFYLEARPGINGCIFKIIKFKTMNDRRDTNGNLLPDAIRLTQVGKILRKFSLDELPQFINVLIGDMSIVGPRPLGVAYLPLYNDFQKRRHEVKPGITGWAQVKGRNALTWDEKFKLDVWYVDNISFFLDIKILFMTPIKVFKREGIGLIGSSIGNVTMDHFKGNEKCD